VSLLGDPLPTLSLTLHRLWQEAVEKEMTQLGKPEAGKVSREGFEAKTLGQTKVLRFFNL